MSRETSLLVLESQAMFDAFGVDRHTPTATWTGEEQLDEVAASVQPPAVARQDGHGGRRRPTCSARPMGTTRRDSEPRQRTDRRPRRHAASAGAAGAEGQRRPRAADQHATANNGLDRPRRAGADRPYDARARHGRDAARVDARRRGERVRRRRPDASPRRSPSPKRALAKKPDSREKHRALVQALSYAGELDRASESRAAGSSATASIRRRSATWPISPAATASAIGAAHARRARRSRCRTASRCTSAWSTPTSAPAGSRRRAVIASRSRRSQREGRRRRRRGRALPAHARPRARCRAS